MNHILTATLPVKAGTFNNTTATNAERRTAIVFCEGMSGNNTSDVIS